LWTSLMYSTYDRLLSHPIPSIPEEHYTFIGAHVLELLGSEGRNIHSVK
jgi:hypothetical protein